MLITKKVECPTCGRKVKKSDLILIETTIKTKVTCCPECIKYLNVRKRIKDDKGLMLKKDDKSESDESTLNQNESLYKSHLKAKNIDILKQNKKEQDILPDEKEIERQALEEQKVKDTKKQQDNLPDEKEIERQALEEQKRLNKISEKKENKTEEKKPKAKESTSIPESMGISKDEPETTKKENNKTEIEKIESSNKKESTSIPESMGISKDEPEKKLNENNQKKSSEKNVIEQDNYFRDREQNNITYDKISDREQQPKVEEKKVEEEQIIGSNTTADRINSTIAKKQKEREFQVTASDWMVTSDPMIDKIALAIEKKQKERAKKGYIKIEGSKVVRQDKTKESEPTVEPIQENKVEEKPEPERTIEEKVDEKIGKPEETKSDETSKTEVKKILKVRCPSCSKEFSIEKKSGKVHLKCPHCGEEGTVEF